MDEATAPTIFEDVRLSAEALATLADRVPTTDSRPPIEVRTPVTDARIGSIPSCEAADVSEAAERGRAAGADWAETPVSERAAVIERFGDLVLDRRDRLLDLIQLETGKARGDALEEVLGVAVSTTYHANHGPDALAEDRRAGAFPLLTDAVVTYGPVGLVGVISPWNYPMMLSSPTSFRPCWPATRCSVNQTHGRHSPRWNWSRSSRRRDCRGTSSRSSPVMGRWGRPSSTRWTTWPSRVGRRRDAPSPNGPAGT